MLNVLIVLAVVGCGPKQQEVPVAEDIQGTIEAETDSVKHPDLGEVMAIEAIANPRSSDRRSTRDAAVVKALVDAMAAATWSEAGGMPRCAPALWLRLVPPSAEDGVTVLWCGMSSPAYVWVPRTGGFSLDAAGSAALWKVSHPIGSADGGRIPPTAITENLSTLSFMAGSNHRMEERIQRVEVYTPAHRTEPATTWPSGAPLAAQHTVDADQAAALVYALDTAGFFVRATRYHSATVENPTTAPPPNSEIQAPEPSGVGWMMVTVTVGEWHRTWREHPAKAVFEHSVSSIERSAALPDATVQLQGLTDSE